ncbi:MAG: DNA mismatch repair endonuclease MutL [Chlamydiia bacterium]|nr:DNA mismatch repair endonuclease MutL [Chlamydiia bacterium]MCP5509520.1 DNA mismatch repair endonuclease MutL [Chlamydiales bacterium]
MTRIQILADETINKIAAGEVVENPAAALKELIENSIDSGACRITIEVEGGGFTSMRVSDNGCGMRRDDALLSLERHATSKISKAEDLEVVSTMGFRGEALASIGAISKLRLITCAEGETLATEVFMDGGRIRFAGDAAREKGTTIEVKQLFFNVPARRKFQKSSTSSTTQIMKRVTDLSLAHPELQFELFCDGKKRIQSTGKGFKSVSRELLGDSFLQQSDFLDTPYIKGFLGKPLASRSTRSGQYLFVNGRAVECPLLTSAITDGFGTRLGAHQHPIFALHFTFPGDWIDVNVHPQKREIRIRDEQQVTALVTEAIAASFASSPPIPAVLENWEHAYEEMDLIAYESPQVEMSFARVPIVGLLSPYLILAAEHSPLRFEKKQRTGFVLVNLKRAEERIYYASTLEPDKVEKEMQVLMLPITLEYNAEQAFTLEKHMDVLHRCGIGVRPFGEQAFVVDALHTHIEPHSVPELIDRLLLAAQKEDPEVLLSKVPKLISRRAPYQQAEAEMIIRELLKQSDTHTAPSGEPIFTHIDEEDVERLFKTA